MDDTCGYIYILTNPSFKEYVKSAMLMMFKKG